MAFQDRAGGLWATLHLTPVRKPVLVGVAVLLGAVVAVAGVMAFPSGAEVLQVERAGEVPVEAEAAAEGERDAAVPGEEGLPAAEQRDVVLPDSGAPSPMCIHVDGAVANPGVYYLDAGSRVVDAVEAAGGATAEARTAAVNLAEVLRDGQQVLIPAVGDEEAAAPAGTAGEPSAAAGLVNVNTAGVAELVSLDGVGEATAEKIIAEREANGPFETIDDLKRVSGIGDKKLAALRDKVCL